MHENEISMHENEISMHENEISMAENEMSIHENGTSMYEMKYSCIKIKKILENSPISHENFWVEKIIPVAKLSVPCIKRSCHDFVMHETFRTDVN